MKMASSLSTDPSRKPIEGLRAVKIVRADPPSAEVARALLDYILSGHVGAGEKLPSERQLSESLGVSRSVVREGIKSLGLLGLIEFRHGGGTYLRSAESDLLPQVIEWGLLLGERRVSDLIEARQELEEIVTKFAATRRTEEQLAEIKRNLEAMKAAKTTDEFVTADVAFHLSVAAASNNGALSNMHTSIAALLRVWIHRVMDAAESFDPSYQEHVPVYEAIARGDVAAASAAAKAHMDGASARLMETLEGNEIAAILAK